MNRSPFVQSIQGAITVTLDGALFLVAASDQAIEIFQSSNGSESLIIHRKTDTAPTGNFIDLQKLDSSTLFHIDITGGVFLSNSKWIAGRNFADTTDINIIRINTSNFIAFGPTRTAASVPANFSADFFIQFQDGSGNNFFIPAMNAGW